MADQSGQVRLIAMRLVDIASNASDEAQELTATIRAVGDHARDIAALCSDLHQAAALIEANTQEQLKLLSRAHTHVSNNGHVMTALADSAATITRMSSQIGDIATRSRMLSLNARIEAARADGSGGFTAVATAMSGLAEQTRSAAADIHGRADSITGSVTAARDVIEGGFELLQLEHQMIDAVGETAVQQRQTSEHVARLTIETVDRIDDAAVSVGRVASAASIVGLLAQQLLKVHEAVAV